MRRREVCELVLLAVIVIAVVAVPRRGVAEDAPAQPASAEPAPEAVKFFEEQVRPVLATNCFKCHGENKQKGDLRLDSLAAMLAGGESGPAVVVGNPDESLLVDAVRHESFEMPPDGKLKDEEILALTTWIKSGAPWPGDHAHAAAPVKREKITDEDRAFWSFQPIANPPVPTIPGDAWSRNAVDCFILDRLQREQIQPAPEAAPEVLARRLYFDLTGLPPTPDQVDAYLRDAAPDRYERLVDRLLASPQYGERAARVWLDIVRYADSDGYKQDDYRPYAWRYRDYVVKSFNIDKPYDQFLREQLAGDEIAPHDPDALAATGYMRLGIYEYNAKDARTQWDFILNDLTDVTADVFLGMGMSCARCHDHKFDPILQADYFRLRAFFAPILPRDDVPLATPAQLTEYNRELAVWLEKTAEIRAELEALERPKLEAAGRSELDRFPADVREMVFKPAKERAPLEVQLAALAQRQANDRMNGVKFESVFKGETLERWKTLKSQLTELERDKPAPLPIAYTVTDVCEQAPPTYIPASRKGTAQEIVPGYLTILDPAPARITAPQDLPSTGRRTALANWLTQADNPLPARVIVNRVWQQHFGRGIVATASDFGALGDRPSHPELLDYLATRFVQTGWRMKALHRLMVTSATYRQTALVPTPKMALQVDPANRLLWRMNTRRLEAEQIRDAMLQASGELDLTAGGEGVEPDRPRRSIYTRVFRNTKDPLLSVFDVPDGMLSTPQRNVTTTATQSLLMINSDLTLARAKNFAARLSAANYESDPQLVAAAYRIAFARLPSDSETNAAVHFLQSERRDETLLDFCHALLNANEFLYID
jgi:mono/diheme cytochrome c family protein